MTRRKHNRMLLKKHLRSKYTDEELAKLIETLPEGFGKQMCISAAFRPDFGTPKPKPTVDNDQSAADDYLDYLESQW